MLICCSFLIIINVEDIYFAYFCETERHSWFFWVESLKNRINVFTVTVDKFITFLLSKIISWLFFQQLAKQNYCVVSSVCRKHKNPLVIVRNPITSWTPLLIYSRLFYSFCEDGPPPPQAATLITSTGPQTHNGEKTQKEMKTQAMCYTGFSAFWT